MWGLVFSGGGGKGAYEIGVWQALEELDVTADITGVSGASVGALNGALFAGNSLRSAKFVWSNISHSKILTPAGATKKLGQALDAPASAVESIVRTGVFSQEGLSKMIVENLNFDNIRGFNGQVYAVCSAVPNAATRLFAAVSAYIPRFLKGLFKGADIFYTILKNSEAVYFNLTEYNDKHIENILLASAAIPLVFSNIRIDGRVYVDGGFTDNVPIKPLYDSGMRKIIVVFLDDDLRVDKAKYPDALFVEIIPSESLGRFFDGVLNFSSENAKELMEMGYRDAIRALTPLFG